MDNIKQFSHEKIQKMYEDSHEVDECTGEWSVVRRNGVPYSLDSLGMIQLPIAFFIKCSKCDAVYFAPGFEQWIMEMIALSILKARVSMDKHHLRFLRNTAGVTQKEVASWLDIDVKEYNKMESLKSTRSLSVDRQVRLKLAYAKIFKLSNVEEILDLGNISDDNILESPQSLIRGIPIDDFPKEHGSM